MIEFESKIRQETKESASLDGNDKMQSLISKLETEKATEVQQLRATGDAAKEDFEREMARNRKATKIMICMQNFVREMLKERLEKREQELQLEIVQISESHDEACHQLKTKSEEFENYRAEKNRENEDDSSQKTGQLDAAEAQL